MQKNSQSPQLPLTLFFFVYIWGENFYKVYGMNVYIIVGESNFGKTTVLRHLMAFAHNCKISSHDINERTIRTINGNDIDVGLQSDSALQEQNVSYVDYESYINGLSKKPQNIILALRKKGGKIGKKKTGWDAVDYIAHFVKIGWNVVAVAALDASGSMNYGLTNPVWQSIQSINNGSYVPSNKVADDVRKLFGWV